MFKDKYAGLLSCIVSGTVESVNEWRAFNNACEPLFYGIIPKKVNEAKEHLNNLPKGARGHLEDRLIKTIYDSAYMDLKWAGIGLSKGRVFIDCDQLNIRGLTYYPDEILLTLSHYDCFDETKHFTEDRKFTEEEMEAYGEFFGKTLRHTYDSLVERHMSKRRAVPELSEGSNRYALNILNIAHKRGLENEQNIVKEYIDNRVLSIKGGDFDHTLDALEVLGKLEGKEILTRQQADTYRSLLRTTLEDAGSKRVDELEVARKEVESYYMDIMYTFRHKRP
jgi:hypothetical protein